MNEREYDFKQGRRGPGTERLEGKTPITIRVDTEILNSFRNRVHAAGLSACVPLSQAGGGDYQTLINEALRDYTRSQSGVLEETLLLVGREDHLRRAQ